MKVCKSGTQTTLVLVCVYLLHGIIPLSLAAQNISAPQMPQVTMPTMPASPQITPETGTVQNQSSSQSKQKQQSSNSSEQNKTQTANEASISSFMTALNMGILGDGSDTDMLNKLLSTNGSGNSLNALTQLGGTNNVSNLLLKQLIEQLSKQNNLSEQNSSTTGNAQASANQAQAEQNTQKEQTVPLSSSRILRFSINGYNMLPTCNTTYFSRPAQDGSFLLTGDRRYISDNAVRSETFYMLFKKETDNTYSLATDVLQDYTNQYSFVYQLAQRSPISAQQTGNLIVIKIDDPAWKLDMLIELDVLAAK